MTSKVSSDPTREIPEDTVLLVCKLVHRNCVKFRMGPSTSMESDIKQDILVKLITPSPNVGTTYLERYDAEKNSIEGFLSRLIYNYFCRLYSRARHPAEQARSLEDLLVTKDADKLNITPVYHDSVSTKRIFEILKERFPFTSGVLFKGELKIPLCFIRVVQAEESIELGEDERVLWRSVANIFLLMMDGFSQEEVAGVMVVSKGWVSKQVHKVRIQPEIVEWAEEFGLNTEEA